MTVYTWKCRIATLLTPESHGWGYAKVIVVAPTLETAMEAAKAARQYFKTAHKLTFLSVIRLHHVDGWSGV